MKKIISVVLAAAMVFTLAVTGFAETYKLGDVDKNGKITPADARQILRFAASLDKYNDEQKLLADVISDGKITPSDARKALRIAASLEGSAGEITLGGEDVGSCVGMSMSKFIEKYGPLEAVGTSDGTKTYRNDEITVVSDPEMISGDKISSISVTGSSYVVNGISVGMSLDEVKSVLSADKWILKASNDVLVAYTKDGMLTKLALNENVVIRITACLAYSLVGSDTSDDTPDTPGEDNNDSTDYLAIEEIPEAAQYFLYGQFGLNGSIYSDGAENNVAMYTDSVNVNMSAVMDMGKDGIANISILILDEGKNENNVYLLNNGNKKYVELSDTTLAILNTLTEGTLDFKKSDFNFNLNLNDPSTLKITSEQQNEDGISYKVYKAKGEKNITNLYFIGNEIKKIVTTDKYGNVITAIEIDEFMFPLPANCFSYKGYTKTGLTTLFDFDVF